MNIYRYKLTKTVPIYLFLIGGSVFFVLFWSIILRSPGSGSLPIFLLIALFLLPAMFLAGALLGFLLWRPISIGDEGIATLMFGKQQKLLSWSSVTQVERVKVYSRWAAKFRNEYWIYAGGSRIVFDDYIERLDRLVERLNGYITEYHIPAFEVDRARETSKAPVATLADIAQGKSLDGVRTPTAKF